MDNKSTAQQEKYIKQCFNKHVDFNYPQTVDEFKINLTFFQGQKTVNNDSVMGKYNILYKPIEMDNV